MRTMNQIYYEEPMFFFGSSQYDNIAKELQMLISGEINLPTDYQSVLDNPEQIIKDTTVFLDEIYRLYNNANHKTYEELDDEVKEDFYMLDDTLEIEEGMSRIKKMISDEPFKFPVKGHLTKIALLEFVEHKKNKSWDLWSLLNHLHWNILNVSPPAESRSSSLQVDAYTLYIIMKVFDYDIILMQKVFGGFDT